MRSAKIYSAKTYASRLSTPHWPGRAKVSHGKAGQGEHCKAGERGGAPGHFLDNCLVTRTDATSATRIDAIDMHLDKVSARQVSVAVLLDNFLSASKDIQMEDEADQFYERRRAAPVMAHGSCRATRHKLNIAVVVEVAGVVVVVVVVVFSVGFALILIRVLVVVVAVVVVVVVVLVVLVLVIVIVIVIQFCTLLLSPLMLV
jgi:hypothetical protein